VAGRDPFAANIEDVDLLIAFAKGKGQHVVLIEAKGYTPWDRNQIQHKIDRLNLMLFEGDNPFFPSVSTHLVLVGSVPPPISQAWPTWVLRTGTTEVFYLKLPQPSTQKALVDGVTPKESGAVPEGTGSSGALLGRADLALGCDPVKRQSG
jgi:hypothetical protein